MFWLLLLVTRTSLCSAATALPDALTADTTLASEGYFVLTWSTAAVSNNNLSLQQGTAAPGPAPIVRAQELPPAGSLTITGLMDGEYTYQLLADNLPLGNPVTVTVQHHALKRALGFFGLGLVLFIILVASILVGRVHAKHSHAD